MKNISFITIVYGILLICSLVLLLIYRKSFKDKANRHATAVFVFISVAIFGYLLLSCSKTLTVAVLANRISYAGNIFLLLELLSVIDELCGIKTNNKVFHLIIFISLLVMLLVMTGGTGIKLYYSSVEVLISDNLTVLVKEYGPLHNIYLIYVCFIFLALLGSIVWSTVKNKTKVGVNPLILLILVSENILIWIIEKIANTPMQLLSVSYVFDELLLLLVFKNIEDYKEYSERLKQKETLSAQNVIETWSEQYVLTEREIEVLNLLIENVPRSEIAKALYISEHTVKKHTAKIYEKLHVTSRSDLLYKLNEEISK